MVLPITRQYFYKNQCNSITFVPEHNWSEHEIQLWLSLVYRLQDLGFSCEKAQDTARSLVFKETYINLVYTKEKEEELRIIRQILQAV